MASDTDIGNLALTKLGVGRVMSLNDDSKAARALKAVFAAKRDTELRLYPWSFAMGRAELASEATPPAFGYERSFPVPADFLRLVDVVGFYPGPSPDYRGSAEQPYQVEGGRILIDLGDPLQIRYVRRVEDTARFDPCFVEALACKLAAEVAPELVESTDRIRLCLGQYKDAIASARRTNAIEGARELPADDSWVLGRL